MKLLITGGVGYVGSHVALAALKAGHEVCLIDNLENAYKKYADRLATTFDNRCRFVMGDICDRNFLISAFKVAQPDAIIHCAGLKSVADSLTNSLAYYDVNVGGTSNVLAAMEASDCGLLIFSSSATVYGNASQPPAHESDALAPVNPYGRTKMIAEYLIEDWARAASGRRALSLRYYNPVGCDASLLVGEDPKQQPANLFPIISEVLSGARPQLDIFGTDYATEDGTCQRDYIHISDLSYAHILALKARIDEPFKAINIGTGQSVSVLQIVKLFEQAYGENLNMVMKDRRAGDVATIYADTSLSKKLIGDYIRHSLEDAVADSLKFWEKAKA